MGERISGGLSLVRVTQRAVKLKLETASGEMRTILERMAGDIIQHYSRLEHYQSTEDWRTTGIEDRTCSNTRKSHINELLEGKCPENDKRQIDGEWMTVEKVATSARFLHIQDTIILFGVIVSLQPKGGSGEKGAVWFTIDTVQVEGKCLGL